MTRRKRKPVHVQAAGIRVRLFRRGTIWWADVRINDTRRRLSLETSEKSTAETNAHELAKEIGKQLLLGVKPETFTLDQLFRAYNEHALPLLNDKRQKWNRSRQDMFITAWGDALVVRRLTQRDIEH